VIAAAYRDSVCTKPKEKHMAKVCELVMLKYELFFGDGELRSQQDYLYHNIYPLLGYGNASGLTIEQVIHLKDHLKNLSAISRIVGIEEFNNDEIVAVHNWESYGEQYPNDWVEQLKNVLQQDSLLSVFVRLPDNIWKY